MSENDEIVQQFHKVMGGGMKAKNALLSDTQAMHG